MLSRINKVTLRRARLVLGWVVNHLDTKPASQIDPAFHSPWDGQMSVSFWAML